MCLRIGKQWPTNEMDYAGLNLMNAPCDLWVQFLGAWLHWPGHHQSIVKPKGHTLETMLLQAPGPWSKHFDKDLNVYRWDIIMMPKVKKSLTQWSQKRNTMSHSYERWQYSRVPSILPPSVERINYLRREPDLCQFLGRLIVRRRQYALEKVVWSLRATSVYFGSAFI